MKKFLADESVDFRIVRSLRNDGYEVEAIVELTPSISDDEILKMAIELEAIWLRAYLEVVLLKRIPIAIGMGSHEGIFSPHSGAMR